MIAAASAGSGWQMILLAVYCVLIVVGSLVGGWLPSVVRLTHTRMQLMISFVGGLMLGIGFFHLLPHAILQSNVEDAMTLAVFGILAMFFLIRAFHVHHHGPLELPDASGTVVADSYRHQLQTTETSGHAHHDHDHDHDHGGHHHHHEVNRLSWMGIASGLALHTLIDGIALGASVRADAAQPGALSLLGFGTFLAVALHKPLDALAITSLMTAAGWSSRSRNLVNAAFAVMCPLGAVLFLIGLDSFNGPQQEIVASAMAFAAGVFICISLGDLLPEMEFHSHNRVPLTITLLTGIVLAWVITYAGH
ncbi:MAG: ZIP family metal transporter [Planctomycetaceae bacterium]|nr:ZIP family metal transporter [Planctomycetaceae bacterium]